MKQICSSSAAVALAVVRRGQLTHVPPPACHEIVLGTVGIIDDNDGRSVPTAACDAALGLRAESEPVLCAQNLERLIPLYALENSTSNPPTFDTSLGALHRASGRKATDGDFLYTYTVVAAAGV